VRDPQGAARAARRLGRERLPLLRGRRALLAAPDRGLRDLVRSRLDRHPRLPPLDVPPQPLPARAESPEDAVRRPPALHCARVLPAARAERADDVGLLPAPRTEVPAGEVADLPLGARKPGADQRAPPAGGLRSPPLGLAGTARPALGLSPRPVPDARS